MVSDLAQPKVYFKTRKKEKRMFRSKIFTMLTAVFIGFVIIMYNVAMAGNKGTDIGADKIKAILLGQKKWIGEVNHGIYGPAVGDYVFEDRGKKVIVKIHAPSYKITCERKVKINSAGFRMTGCNIGIADMFYDPSDSVYPFKTKGNNLEYDFKLKAQ